MLIALTIEVASISYDILEVAAREFAVAVVVVVLLYVKVYRSLALVSIAIGKDILNELDLL